MDLRIYDLDITASGSFLATGCQDGTVRLWETGSGMCRKVFSSEGGIVHSLALSRDEKVIVAGYEDGTVRVWSPNRAGCRELKGHGQPVGSVAISPDGTHAVTGCCDDTLMHYRKDAGDWSIRYWNLRNGKCLRILMGHNFWVSALGFCTEDVVVSAGWDSTLRLWDLRSGKSLNVLEGHEQFVTSLAISRDGQRAVSGSADFTVRLWDLRRGICAQTLGRHQLFVCDVALDEAHGQAFSSSLEGVIKVWDITTGSCVDEKRLETGHVERVPLACVSPGAGRILVAAQGDTVKCWEGIPGTERPIRLVNPT
jgi:WD40 repeat protein